MVRPFDIRDMSAVQRLSVHGCALAHEIAAIDGVNPMLNAIRAAVQTSVPFPSISDRHVILTHRDDGQHADSFGIMEIGSVSGNSQVAPAVMTYLAPLPETEKLKDAWIDLLDAFAGMAAAVEARFMVAEVPETGRVADAFLTSGFVPILHQDILKLPVVSSRGTRKRPAEQDLGHSQVPGLRLQTDKDDLYLKLLAARVIPKLATLHMANMDPTRLMHQTRVGFMLMHAQEACGHVSVNKGRKGSALRMLIRHDVPEIQPHLAEMLETILVEAGIPTSQPIYCMLPSYLSWMLPILDGLGFVHHAATTVMLKHITASVRVPVWQTQRNPLGVRLANYDASIRLT